MKMDDWLADTRTSYDTVAVSYADFVRGRLPKQPYHPMKVHVHRRQPDRVATLLRDAGFEVEANLLIDPDHEVPGAIIFARRRT